MKKILLSNLLMFLSFGATASNPSGAFIGLDFGYADVEKFEKMEPALSINAGYRFNPYLAVEGDYTVIMQFDDKNGYHRKFSDSFLIAAAKGTLPLNNTIDLFAKTGLGVNYADANINNSYHDANKSSQYAAFMLGGGVNFNLSNHFALKLQDSVFIPFTNSDSGFGNVNLLSVGAEYRF